MSDKAARERARAVGQARYLPSQPCKHGHTCERYVRSNICVDCGRSAVKANRHANPERTRVLRKNHRDAMLSRNPDYDKRVYHALTPVQLTAKRRSDRKSKRANREKVVAFNREWRRRNPGKTKAHAKRYGAKNKWRVLARTRKRQCAQLLRAPSWVDTIALAAVYERAAKITQATGIRHHVDHIFPLRGKTVSGLHVPSNLQILTDVENLRKANLLPDTELVESLYSHPVSCK